MKKISVPVVFSDDGGVRAGKFLAGMAILFTLFWFVFSLAPLEWFEHFYAFFSLEFLKLVGFQGYLEYSEPVRVFLENFPGIILISFLCTGLLELWIIWSAILSSFGIEPGKRLIGAALAALFLVAFNFFRIIATILIIGWLSLEAGDLAHNLLFRVFLLFTIAGFYYYWFRWATGAA